MTLRGLLVLAITGGMLPAMAGGPLPGPARLTLRPLTMYLQLSDEQAQSLARSQQTLSREIQALAQAAALLPAAPATVQDDPSALCQRASTLVARHRQQIRDLLTAPQRERLAVLEQAFALMPLVESAQSVGLISDRQRLPPTGMPTGTVEVEQSWQRVQATPLPGCVGTRIHRELAPPDYVGQKKPGPAE